ncbi:MAG: GTPase ObgE [Vampirovibrio sp.]|nr:GTPase ObgE [Vampirovibrio sp.]
MFLDKVKIHIKSGAGGNGKVAWRREKFVPYGGPAGGDGGNGGNVYLEATNNLNTLLDFKYKSIFKAEDGENGRSKNQYGKSGKDLVIQVPCGTVVRDAETGKAIADLVNPGQRAIVASGGRGGRGNTRFLSSVRKAPQFCEPGEPCVERELELELKLIADVGIIGLPNAGKSTLISVISSAKPKIADYPFTTLAPNLGVVKKPDGDAVVVADIPGLIEGASEGSGLGHEFLRHVERTRLLLHLVDISGETDADPLVPYRLIQEELKRYSQKLAEKPQLLVLSKLDTVDESQLNEIRQIFAAAGQKSVYEISSVTRKGVDTLVQAMLDRLDTLPKEEMVIDVVPDDKAFDHDDSAYKIIRHKKSFSVVGGRVERLVAVTDMRNKAAVHRLLNILKSMGVYKALKEAGVKEGQTVSIAGIEFEHFSDDPPEDSELEDGEA